MIGQHKCKEARNTDLKQAIAIGLDEALTAFEEAIYDLSDEQLWEFPIPGRNNIAWIAMHMLENLDINAVHVQAGRRVAPEDYRWSLWECKPNERPNAKWQFLSQSAILARLKEVRAAVEEILAAASEADLQGPSAFDAHWRECGKTRADAYLRTISHTQAHVRQIWLLRGALGLIGGDSWPMQHWA
jgi:hypothetical protein